jgi:MFS family permease
MIRRVFSDYYEATADFSRNAKLFLASVFLAGMSFSAFGVIFNLYLVELGFREGFIGNLLSVGALAMSLPALPAGLACDRIGRKKSLLLSGFFVSVFVLIRATTLKESLLLAA